MTASSSQTDANDWRAACQKRDALHFTFETGTVDGDLADALKAGPAEPGTLDLFWLGQAGFALRSDSRLVLIDPYLSDALAEKYRGALFTHQRMMQSPLPVDAPVNADFLLVSHGHSDHLDPGLPGPFMQANPECLLFCPASIRALAIERGVPEDRIVPMEAGQPRNHDGFAVDAIPSAHETIAYNDRGEHMCLGYIIEMAGLRLYHSGDCVPYDGLAVELARRRIDIALLPVNGRDEFRTSRGIPGNFTIHEAARLCFSTGIRFLVPHHFGMFDFNTVGVDEIRQRLDGCLGLDYWLPAIGGRLTLRSVDRCDSRRFTL